MIRFAARRLGQGIVTLFALSMVSFVLMVTVPGSYYDGVRSDPRVTQETVQSMRDRAGEMETLPQRYGTWLASVAKGEGGYSIAYQVPVLPLILPRLAKTLELAALGLFITWVAVLALASWAVRSNLAFLLSSAIQATLGAIPELVLACGLITAGLHWGWIRESDVRMPALVLGLSGIPALLPQVRSALVQVAGAPYLALAKTHGIHGWRFFLIFWLRAAGVPLVSLFGISAGTILSSTLVVEVVYGWPGIGSLFLSSIESRDSHVVLAIVLVSSAVFSATGILTDLFIAAADPRIREEV